MIDPRHPSTFDDDSSGNGRNDNESPGVPVLNDWKGVYVFVLVSFIVIVGLLAVFTSAYNG